LRPVLGTVRENFLYAKGEVGTLGKRFQRKMMILGLATAVLLSGTFMPYIGPQQRAFAAVPEKATAGTFADSPQPGQIRIYAGASAGKTDTAGNRMAGSIVEEKYLDHDDGSIAAIESQGNGVAEFSRYGWHKKATKRVANGSASFSYKIPVDPALPAPLYVAMEGTGEIKLTAEGVTLLDTGNSGLGVQTPWEFRLDDASLWADGYLELKFEDADPSDGEGVNLLWVEVGPSSVWRDRVKHIVWDTSDVLWQVGYYEGTASEFKGVSHEIDIAQGDIESLAPDKELTIRWNQNAPAAGKRYYLLAGLIGGAGQHKFDIGSDGSVEATREASKERITDLDITALLTEGDNVVRIDMAQGAKLDFVSLVEVTDGATKDDSLRVVFKGNEMAEHWTRLVNNTMYFHMDMMTEKSTGFIDASLPNGIFPLLYWVADSAPAMLEMARWGYTDEAKQASLFRSASNHLGGDNGAAGLVFATISYLIKGDNYAGEYADLAWPILEEGLDYYVAEVNASPYHLIKGTGLETTNKGYGIYNNSIAYFALLAGAETADGMGKTAKSGQWLAAADLLAEGMNEHLVADENLSWLGRTIPADTWRYSLHGDKTDGSDAAWINAGWFGVGSQEELFYGYKTPAESRNSAVEKWREVTNNTLDYHSENYWADWKLYGHNRGFGTDYGVLSERGGWPLLSMFMSDRMEMAKKNLQHIIWNSTDLNFAHDNEGVQETSPWLLVREVNRSDHGIAEPNEIGNGGDNEDMNLVEYIIALKNVRVMAGLDDSLEGADNVGIIPRIPNGWDGVQVNEWPANYRDGSGTIARTNVSFDYDIKPEQATLRVSAGETIEGSRFRFGPFDPSANVVAASENGSPMDAGRYHEEVRGDAKWVWVEGRIGTAATVYQVDMAIPHLVVADQFQSDELAGWTATGEGDWSAKQGVVAAASPAGSILLGNESQADDVIFSADVNITSGAAGISFRTAADGAGGYDFTLDADAGAEGMLSLTARGGDPLYTAPMHVNRNRTYTLKVVAAGPILMGYLDGVKVFHIVDSTAASGQIGLYARGAASFDNAVAVSDTSAVEIPELESVTISSYKTDRMLITQEKEIPVIATFTNGETMDVTRVPALREYHFSEPDVLTELAGGLLRADKPGTTGVYATVTLNGVTKQSNTLQLTAEELNYVEIYYAADELAKSLMIGESAQVWPWAKMGDGKWWFLGYMPPSMEIEYHSSNPLVATVAYDPDNADPDSRSMLRTHGAGTAVITMDVTVNGVKRSSPNSIAITVIDPDAFEGFADDFSGDTLSGWSSRGPGVWSLDNGQAVVSNPQPTGWDSWNIRDAQGKDFVYSGDITFRSGQAAGLSFRMNDTASAGYDVILDKNDGIKLAGRPYRAFKSAQASFVDNRTYHLKVVARGANIKVYLDGALKIDYNETDYGYTFGKFGMFSFQSTAAFDNLSAETKFKLAAVTASAGQTALTVGDTTDISLSAVMNSEEPADLAGAGIVYASDNEAVATVSADGRIAAVGEGSAQITASVTLNGITVASNAVAIAVGSSEAPVQLAEAIAAAEPAAIGIGGTATLSVTGKLSDASAADLSGATISWSGDNNTVATVSPDGKVTAHRLGTARFTATVTLNGVTVASNPVLVTVAGTQAFAENFDEGEATGWTPNGGVWRVEDGRMKVAYTTPNSWFDAWNIIDKQGDDFSYSGEVTLLDGNSAGLSFRTNANGTQGYDVIFSIFEGLKLAKRPYAVLDSYNDFEKKLNQTYRIRIVAEGAHIQVYLDDTLTIDTMDTTYAAGQFGLFAFQGTATYDNLRAEDIDRTAPAWTGAALTASEVTKSSLLLTWTAASDAGGIAKYRIFRDGEPIGETPGDATTFAVDGLTPETAYEFRVEAADVAGNWSVNGPSVTATTLAERTEPGPGPVTPTIPAPQQPDNRQTVSAQALTPSADGTIAVELGEGKNELLLPAGAQSLLEGRALIIRGQHETVDLSAETLKAAFGAAQTAANPNGRLIVEIGKLPADQAEALVAQAGNSRLKLGLAGAVVTVGFASYSPDGTTAVLDAASLSSRLIVKYDDNAIDERLLGFYRYDETAGQWIYMPEGAIDRDRNEAALEGAGLARIALLSYDRTFDDVAPSHWAYGTLKAMSALHLVNGTTEATFDPGRLTTRAEFTAMLARALGLQATGKPLPFTDVNTASWYADSVSAAYEAGLINGRSAAEFAPNGLLTREEMAVLLVRALTYAGQNRGSSATPAALSDQGQISAWAANAVGEALRAGLMRGTGAGKFAPQAHATRAETAQALYNLLNEG